MCYPVNAPDCLNVTVKRIVAEQEQPPQASHPIDTMKVGILVKEIHGNVLQKAIYQRNS